MTKICAICSKKVGRLLSWSYTCSCCGRIVCGAHEKDGLCTECRMKADAIVVLEREDAQLRVGARSLGIVVSKPCTTFEAALVSLKERCLGLGAFAVVGATLSEEDETAYMPIGTLDDYKKGKAEMRPMKTTMYTLRGEALIRSPPINDLERH